MSADPATPGGSAHLGGGTAIGPGPLTFFARHRTAGNLVMIAMLVLGFVALGQLNRQFFPDFGIDSVRIDVVWSGSTAEDVDLTIVQAIEPEVRFLSDVDSVTSVAHPGVASIWVNYTSGADLQQALSEVEAAVARVSTLPEGADDPEVQRIVRYDPIATMVLSGPYPERALQAWAKDFRDQLLDRGIDRVTLKGLRDPEFWVEIDTEMLRRLGLTLDAVAARIATVSRDVPGGDLGDGQRRVRSLGSLETAEDLGALELKAFDDGRRILLRDVATVTETYEAGGTRLYRDGLPAVEIQVLRALSADALDVARTMNAWLEETRPTLPENLSLQVYNEFSNLIRDRIALLVNNGMGGLVLVCAILFVFLSGRVAFWVAAGIPISIFAALGIMLALGMSINMMSLFAMIMALGIVVDDAIVVGEHIQTRHSAGDPPLVAAVTGARRMLVPVTCASLTTIAAFLPLAMIGGIIGDIVRDVPLVVVAVVLASLVECLLVLPAHMRQTLEADAAKPKGRVMRALDRFHAGFDRRFQAFREGPFRRLVLGAIDRRWFTLSIAAGAFILAIGLIAGGRVGFTFFPVPEADIAYANVTMTPGTPRAQTEAQLEAVRLGLERAADRLETEADRADGGLIRMAVLQTGAPVNDQFGTSSGDSDVEGGLSVELLTADRRSVRMEDFIEAWKAEVPALAGLETLQILAARGGPPGRDVDVQLRGDDIGALKDVSLHAQALLATYPGVSELADTMPFGAPELVVRLTPRGQALGFTTESVGSQVRAALDGVVARRFTREDEEVTVRVQLPRAALDLGALWDLELQAPSGRWVPLTEIAEITEQVAYGKIQREDGRRQIAVQGEIDSDITSTTEVLDRLRADGLLAYAAERQVSVDFAGKAEEQADTFGDIRWGSILGLTAIYVILAWVMAGYLRPIAVLAVIPLGFVGAVFGHFLVGYDLTMLSVIALVGLSGIVVNDSIVLVTAIDDRAQTQPRFDAIVDGVCDRLRAVILTSATTVGGLLPLMFETSLQAQFLKPMALTLIAGLACSTLMVLFVVPSLLAVIDRAGRLESAPDGDTPVIRGPQPAE